MLAFRHTTAGVQRFFDLTPTTSYFIANFITIAIDFLGKRILLNQMWILN